MLKGISNRICPELLKVLDEMGHGDTIVLADGNFPAYSVSNKVIRADSSTVKEMLEAILPLFPLDVDNDFAFTMKKSDKEKPEVYYDYLNMLDKFGYEKKIEEIERFSFYDVSKKAYAVVITTDKTLFANIILKKGTL